MKPLHQNAVGICGWKNSGKTTLIEGVIPLLRGKGLSVLVIKHDTHGIDVDRPGKDSDRFYRAGADVLLEGPDQEVLRRHIHDSGSLDEWLEILLPRYDLILVEGHKNTPLPRVWLNDGRRPPPPEERENILLELSFQDDRAGALMKLLADRLESPALRPPLFGCILIGGQSQRMGTPKHLISDGGKTWIEELVQRIGEVAQQVVIAGDGTLPDSLHAVTHLPDVPGVQGPMAGILAAMRWNPGVSWLTAACDMPQISKAALEWLHAGCRPGVWAVMPHVPGLEKEVQPLLAAYDFRARTLLESAARNHDYALVRLASHEKVITPEPPGDLARAWRNINSAEDLQDYRSSVDLKD